MSVNKVNSDGSLKRIAGGTLYADAPLGTILAFGGTTAPAGWMLCQGQAISRTTYAKLFAIIGTAFGTGDGSTTFNLPDLREATTKGIGENPSGASHVKSGGLALGEFIDDRLQDHTHQLNTTLGGGSAADMFYRYDGSTARNTGNIKTGRKGATTEVKAVGVNYIIKVMMVSLPADFMSSMVDYMNNQNELSDYEEITLGTSSSNATLMEYDGYLNVNISSAGAGTAYISDDNKSTWKVAWNSTGDTGFGKAGFIVVAKGDYVYAPGYNSAKACYARFYKDRDYTKRA